MLCNGFTLVYVVFLFVFFQHALCPSFNFNACFLFSIFRPFRTGRLLLFFFFCSRLYIVCCTLVQYDQFFTHLVNSGHFSSAYNYIEHCSYELVDSCCKSDRITMVNRTGIWIFYSLLSHIGPPAHTQCSELKSIKLIKFTSSAQAVRILFPFSIFLFRKCIHMKNS